MPEEFLQLLQRDPSHDAQSPPPTALVGYVTRVIDGDTISVAIGNHIEKVRYIGINTPEIHHPTKGREPYGDAARAANARLVEGRWLQLVFDVQARDTFGRLLAYVYLGSRFVNAELVWQGYVEAATYPPNVRYADYLVGLQRQARESKRGLWADPDAVAYYRPRPPDYAAARAAGSLRHCVPLDGRVDPPWHSSFPLAETCDPDARPLRAHRLSV
jgi:endonuclease YncB( thermonuclease family)